MNTTNPTPDNDRVPSVHSLANDLRDLILDFKEDEEIARNKGNESEANAFMMCSANIQGLLDRHNLGGSVGRVIDAEALSEPVAG